MYQLISNKLIKSATLVLCCMFSTSLLAEDGKAVRQVKHANRIEEAPVIDGKLDDAIWEGLENEKTHFYQFEPANGESSSFETAVRIHYSDNALYVAARMYDPEPANIKTELGPRDSFGRNADMFGIAIDAYNSGQNAFYFIVSAAGVQTDKMVTPSGLDYNWDAVWKSAVVIDDDGWTVEMEIPYFALRFPQKPEQEWSINLMRRIERKRELSYWNYVDNAVNGFVTQFGKLSGISNISPPLRLSVSPYITTYYDHNGHNGQASVTGGMDLKYGINEAFTLDMTLIPDFGQTISDNQVVNLSPFEIQFAENRAFFTEGTEMFNKGGLFYSRRVGQSFGSLQLDEHETLLSRPADAPLLNATKISGRNENGTGLGFFNAVTNATYASIEDGESGEIYQRKIDDISNFNVAVYDQNLRNNSNFSLINTNVTRFGQGDNANVTGTDFRLLDESNTYQLHVFSAVSHINKQEAPDQTGYRYNVSFNKVSGNFRFGAGRNVESKEYEINDMGFLRNANNVYNWARASYNIFKPFGIFNRVSYTSYIGQTALQDPNYFTRLSVYNGLSFQTTNFLNFYSSFSFRPTRQYDYFEPRVDGRVFFRPKNYDSNFTFSTDPRNDFYLALGTGMWKASARDQLDYWFRFQPRVRFNDKISVNYSAEFSKQIASIGYVDQVQKENANTDIIFGNRDIDVYVNIVGLNLNLSSTMAVNFRARHYWNKVNYVKLYNLMDDGDIGALTGDYQASFKPEDYSSNVNIFNIDATYTWQVAPGSFVNVMWKDQVYTSNREMDTFFVDNLRSTMRADHFNNLSVRFIYFLDYVTARNALRSGSN